MNRVLIAGRSEASVLQLQKQLSKQQELVVDTRVINNGHADPLHGVTELPTVLVLVLLDNSTLELDALSARSASVRPPLIVISNELDTDTMRVAMRAGARDFLNIDGPGNNLVESLYSLCNELRASAPVEKCQIVTVFNASGGSGSSMVAANLAYLSTLKTKMSTALLDLDLQTAPLSLYFDLTTKNCVLDALERVDELDAVSVEAYSTRHASGLHIFSAIPDGKAIQREQFEQALTGLVSVLSSRYQRVFIDLPNQLDSLGVATIEHSDVIILIVQQNLISVRNATRMLEILRQDLLISDEHIIVVVNRFNRNASIELSDIRRSLHAKEMLTIPNQYRHVSESIDIGVPLLDHMPNSGITKSLLRIEQRLTGAPEDAGKSIIEKTFSSFLRH